MQTLDATGARVAVRALARQHFGPNPTVNANQYPDKKVGESASSCPFGDFAALTTSALNAIKRDPTVLTKYQAYIAEQLDTSQSPDQFTNCSVSPADESDPTELNVIAAAYLSDANRADPLSSLIRGSSQRFDGGTLRSGQTSTGCMAQWLSPANDFDVVLSYRTKSSDVNCGPALETIVAPVVTKLASLAP